MKNLYEKTSHRGIMNWGIMLAIICAVMVAACNNPMGNKIDTVNEPGYGMVSVDFDGMGRTLFPATELFTNFEYTFTQGSTVLTPAPDSNGLFTLQLGEWEVAVNAYVGTVAPVNLAAAGTGSVTVVQDTVTPVTITLTGRASDGEGIFTYDIQFPAGAELVEFALERLPELTVNVVDTPPVPVDTSLSGTITDVPSGFYLLTVRMSITEDGFVLFAGKDTVVHIYNAMITEYGTEDTPIVFAANEFFLPPMTVTFNSDGGSNVDSITVNGIMTIAAPAAPAKPFTGVLSVPGLYAGDINSYTFVEWRKPDDTPWDFQDDVVTESITLTAYWTEPAPIATVEANNVAAAVTYINAANNQGAYTLLIDEPFINTAAQTLNQANRSLSIIGIGDDPSEIQLSANGRLFTVSNTTASLTIGDKVTLVGRSTGGNGNANNNNSVVYVGSGAFTMDSGSTIMGNTTSSYAAAVHVTSTGSTFTVKEGALITGNSHTASYGAVLIESGGRVAMEGGSITGNNGLLGDVLVDSASANALTLSGNTAIGVLTLNAASATARYPVTIGSGWTGSIGALNLRRGVAGMNDVIATWFNAATPVTIMQAAAGHTLSEDDLEKVLSLGNFISSAASANTRPINPSDAQLDSSDWRRYEIELEGTPVTGRLKDITPPSDIDFNVGMLVRLTLDTFWTDGWDDDLSPGDTVTFRLENTGNAFSSIEWDLNGRVVSRFNELTLVDIRSGNHTLTVIVQINGTLYSRTLEFTVGN